MTDEKKTGTTQRAPRRRTRKPAAAKPTAATTTEPGSRSDPAHPPQRAASTSATPTPAEPARARTPSAPAAPRVLATVPIHVRWHDLDAFNHVNNASFLILLEEARLQWLRRVPGEWFGEHAMPVAASIQLNYRKPITWPADGIDVVLTCERLGNTSMTLGNRVVERSDHACVYAEGNLVMVWMDPATGKPVPLPEAIRKACAG